MIRYMSRPEIAVYLGRSRATVNAYKLPEPDAKVGRAYGWHKDTIDVWFEEQLGKGPVPDAGDRTPARGTLPKPRRKRTRSEAQKAGRRRPCLRCGGPKEPGEARKLCNKCRTERKR